MRSAGASPTQHGSGSRSRVERAIAAVHLRLAPLQTGVQLATSMRFSNRRSASCQLQTCCHLQSC